MINPTVGRVVWYYPDPARLNANRGDRIAVMQVFSNQPMAATVAHVYNERHVNLSVVDHAGFQFSVRDVPLLQDNDVTPSGKDILHYATWMPYQKVAAEKQPG